MNDWENHLLVTYESVEVQDFMRIGSRTTLNYWMMMVERYPNGKEEVGG